MKAEHDLRSPGLGAVLKTALDAVIVMRMDGTIAGWNDVAERTFGWSFAEANGLRMSEIIIPERHRSAHEAGLQHYHATGEGPVLDHHIEIEALHRNGRELPIELSITRTDQFDEPVFLGFLRDISDRRDAERRQELLIGELNHRVKNLLGVVSGIAHQTVRASTSLDDFGPAFAGRLASLGKAHEIVTAATWEQASLQALMDAMLGPFARGEGAQVQYGGPEVMLAPRHLLSISMIMHELSTNAVKHGALSTAMGSIAVAWQTAAKRLSINWFESGLTGVASPARQGFGMKMIAINVRHELRGVYRSHWRDGGLHFELAFNLEEAENGTHGQ